MPNLSSLPASDVQRLFRARLIRTVFFAVLINDLGNTRWSHTLMDVVIDHDDGCQSACAKATSHVEGKQSIGCRFANLDSECCLECGQHFLAPADVARGSHTDANDVLTAWNGRKEGVESDDSRDFAVGLFQGHADLAKGRLREIAVRSTE